MPTLADIYSGIDTAKRKAGNFIRQPLSTLQEMIALGNDEARQINQQTALSAQGARQELRGQPMTQEQATADQDLQQKLIDQMNIGGITVYHGGPHKFAKFDTSKIGTGEGSQMQGHGLYLAEAPETARQYAAIAYKPGLAQGTAYGNEQATLDAIIKLNANNFTDGDVNKLAEIIKRKPGAFRKPEAMLERISNYVDNNPAGYVYKVDLPDKHIEKMLDYEGEIKNQHKIVRDFAKKLGLSMNDTGFDLLQKVGRDKTGSETLKMAGIPGVKYLDQMRFGDNQAKRALNYVVFDPDHLTILERNTQTAK
jgi:hypothetical protein